MVQDDKNRWALFIKPEGKAGYSVYPEKDDLNRFFTTLKQSLDNIDKVRGELARKYYALAESKPDLKVDLFHTADESIDLNRIQRVAVFKTKNGAILCAPTIDGSRSPEASHHSNGNGCGSPRTGTVSNNIWRQRFSRTC